MTMIEATPYEHLTPDCVLDALNTGLLTVADVEPYAQDREQVWVILDQYRRRAPNP